MVVIGGLFSSTALILVVLPVFIGGWNKELFTGGKRTPQRLPRGWARNDNMKSEEVIFSEISDRDIC